MTDFWMEFKPEGIFSSFYNKVMIGIPIDLKALYKTILNYIEINSLYLAVELKFGET